MKSVYGAVRTGYLNQTDTISSLRVNEECLLRDTDWVFKLDSFGLKGLIIGWEVSNVQKFNNSSLI